MKLLTTDEGLAIVTTFGDIPVVITEKGRIYIPYEGLRGIVKYLKLVLTYIRDPKLATRLEEVIVKNLKQMRTEIGTVPLLRLEALDDIVKILDTYRRATPLDTQQLMILHAVMELLQRYRTGIAQLEIPALMYLARQQAKMELLKMQQRVLREL